ncbi:MAG: response regulator, partial [Gemmatimonadaceae bacterium]
MRTESPSSSIRVLLVDDHAIVREGIRHVLSAEDGFEIVGEAADGTQAVALAETLQPDVLVLDLSLPPAHLSGLEVAALIRERVPRSSILVLSIHDREEYVLESVRAGAHGYLRKDSSPAELRNAIRTLYAGGSVFSAPVARSLSSALHNERAKEEQRARVASLTSRERDVLIEIARGRSNKEVAGQFSISIRTVESHRETLMRKLGVRGVASLTRLALDAGLLAATEPRPSARPGEA